MVRLLPARSVETHLQLPRPLRLLADRRLAEETPPRPRYAHPGPPAPAPMEDRRRRDRVLPRRAGRGDSLPLPRSTDPEPLGECHGVILWRAGCPGMGTSGSEGGQQKPTSRKAGRALLPDPYTKLAGPAKGVYYDAYVMIDIYSRYIVGARVHPHESGLLAEQMMREVFDLHGTPQVVHADRGTSMTSKTVAQLLADLEVTRSHSRPKVSNDNPYSEAWFKTLKYAPTFPERFGCLADAQQYMDAFVDGYNHHHRHTGIGLHTPADVHYGLAATVRAGRQATLAQARTRHPERFTTSSNPKIINLPQAASINRPPETAAA